MLRWACRYSDWRRMDDTSRGEERSDLSICRYCRLETCSHFMRTPTRAVSSHDSHRSHLDRPSAIRINQWTFGCGVSAGWHAKPCCSGPATDPRFRGCEFVRRVSRREVPQHKQQVGPVLHSEVSALEIMWLVMSVCAWWFWLIFASARLTMQWHSHLPILLSFHHLKQLVPTMQGDCSDV